MSLSSARKKNKKKVSMTVLGRAPELPELGRAAAAEHSATAAVLATAERRKPHLDPRCGRA
jgi:hypothetical protein